ncbi:MAG: class I SAM-dependent methyltransferase [Acidobacteria bacterium]|nr:class I SAM-dependent methyltransferase [Acidobacteriota bacterium]
MAAQSSVPVPHGDWDELAHLDPLWAILTDKEKKFGKWNPEEFFASGQAEIDVLMESCGLPRGDHGRVLDFGCGVGRLSRSLRAYFGEVHGVDISEEMIRLAKEFNPNCRFVVNQADNLKLFADEFFDFVYSNRVLQHQPSQELVARYLREFARVVKPQGTIVVQIPYKLRLRRVLEPRRRVYSFLKTVGFSPSFLYRRLHLNPIHNCCMTPENVHSVLSSAGARVLRSYPDHYNEYSMSYIAVKVSPL